MASPALATGAGAGDGLETLLTRLMAEAKLKQVTDSQTETSRHNMAAEDIQRSQLESVNKDRIAREQEQAQAHTDIRNDRMQDNGRALGDEIPAGTALNAGNDVELNHGNPDPAISQMVQGGVGSLLKMRQASPAVPENLVAPDDTGDAQPRSYIKLKSYKQQHEDAAVPKGDYNKEQKTVLYRGKPVEAVFDPRKKAGEPGMYTLPDGTDITKEAQHYEKPPTPDRVLIPTGDGYMRRPDAATKLGKGEDVPLATTSSTRTMSEGAKMLQPKVKNLEATATELDRRGQFGPVMSRVRDLMAKAGTTLESDNPDEAAKAWGALGQAISSDPTLSTDRLAGKFATSLGLLATGAGRVHGGARGGSSAMMLSHFKELLSSSSTLAMFQGRLDALSEYLDGYAAGPDAAAAPKGDIYDEYLKRTKKP